MPTRRPAGDRTVVERHLLGEVLRQPAVVGVEECDELTRGCCEREITGGGRAAVAPCPHKANARVDVGLDERRGVVGGGVVADDDLDVSYEPRQHRVDRVSTVADELYAGTMTETRGTATP